MRLLSKSIAAFALMVTISGIAYGRDPDWFIRRSVQLEQVISLNDSDEKIEALAAFVRIGHSGRMDEEQQAIFQRSQTTLLQIPGHAIYFQNKLESLRTKTIEFSKLAEDPYKMKVNQAFGEYEAYQRNVIFPTLALLPSSETISVLGHFLNQPEGRDGKDLLGRPRAHGDFVPHPIAAGAATIAIRQLGIEHPPFRQRPGARDYEFSPEEIDAWKDWWNEVKEGKHTYRFIGSNIDYGPDGPATKEQLQRIERNRQREATANRPRSAVSSAEADEASHAKTRIALGGAMLVLLASIFYVFKAKRR